MKVMRAALIVCWLGTAALAHATRVALISQGGPRAGEICAVVQARLSGDAGIELLEREALGKVLTEQTVAGSGEMDATTAVRLGKIARADVLADIESNSSDLSGFTCLVVFDAASGVRLLDAPLGGSGIEALSDSAVTAIHDALRKREAGANARTVCLLTVRNVDLPPSERGVCEGMGALLQRGMIQSPQITLLERERLAQVNQERALAGGLEQTALLASVVMVEMDIFRSGGTSGGIGATASLYDLARRPLGHATVFGDIAHLAHFSVDLSNAVLKILSIAAIPVDQGSAVQRVKLEADRFGRESHFRAEHSDWSEAVIAADAAHALDPDEPRYDIQLTSALIMQGAPMAEREAMRGGKPGTPPSDFDPGLQILRRGADKLCVVGRQPEAPAGLFPAVKRLEDFLVTLHRGADGRCRPMPEDQPYAADRFRFTNEQQQDLDAIIHDYRSYTNDIEEPAARAAVKDNETFLAYTRLLGRILGDECHLFARNSNEFTAKIAERFPAWVTLAGKFWTPGQVMGPVEFLDNSLRTYWTTVPGHVWEGASWEACWPTPDAKDIENWQAAAASMRQAHPPEEFLPGLDLWIKKLKEPAQPTGLPRSVAAQPPSGAAVAKEAASSFFDSTTLVDLAGRDRDFTSISQPLVADGIVYAVAAAPSIGGVELQLLKFDDNGPGSRTVVARLRCSNRATGNGPPASAIHLFSASRWLCSEHLILSESGADGRVFVLPLEGGDGRVITSATELPGDRVHVAADLGDTLYLQVSSFDHGAYLIGYDLKSGTARTLISSRRQDQKSPFENTAPMEMDFMLSDPPRDRILFFASNSDWKSEKTGLWQYSRRTEQFKKLLGTARPVAKDGDGARAWASTPLKGEFVLQLGQYRVIYDLNTDTMRTPGAGAFAGLQPQSSTYPIWNNLWRAWGPEALGANQGDGSLMLRTGNVHALQGLATGVMPPYSQMLGQRILVADETGVWILNPR